MFLALNRIKVTIDVPCFGLDQGSHGWALLWVGSGEPWMGFALGWIRVAMDGLCFGLDRAALRG